MSSESRTCVEIGSLIFALISCIVLFVASAGSGLGILYEVFCIIKYGIRPNWDSTYAITGLLVAALTLSSIAFAFSFLLCKGIIQKKPHYIKMYLVYGAVVLLLIFAAGVVSSLLFASLLENETLVTIGFSVSAVCFVYAAILGMILATYKQCRKEISYKHIVLIENKITS